MTCQISGCLNKRFTQTLYSQTNLCIIRDSNCQIQAAGKLGLQQCCLLLICASQSTYILRTAVNCGFISVRVMGKCWISRATSGTESQLISSSCCDAASQHTEHLWCCSCTRLGGLSFKCKHLPETFPRVNSTLWTLLKYSELMSVAQKCSRYDLCLHPGTVPCQLGC